MRDVPETVEGGGASTRGWMRRHRRPVGGVAVAAALIAGAVALWAAHPHAAALLMGGAGLSAGLAWSWWRALAIESASTGEDEGAEPEATGEAVAPRPARDLEAAVTAVEAARDAAINQAEMLFDGAPVGVLLTDAEGRITAANAAVALMAPRLRGGLSGRNVNELVAPDDRPALQRALAQGRAGHGGEPAVELAVAGAAETVVSVYVAPIPGEDSQPRGYLLHFIDVTERRTLELQFAQSQKMQAVGQLAGGVAHDFNNLLTAMIGFCDLLLSRHGPGDPSFADIVQIKQNANRAAGLVRQLLAFSRRQRLDPRVLNLADVLSELSHLLRRLIGETVTFNLVHERDLGLVRVDQTQFEQVIINLAVNARDAMSSSQGTLTIHTANVSVRRPMRRGTEVLPAGDYVLVEVIDTGCGISRENLPRIFEPFFTTKEVGSGTGLGLSTVYGIVKQTGGFVFVDSAVGEGTTFSIYLPRVAGEEMQPKEAAVEPGGAMALSGVGTILLVEDEDPVRLFAARALRAKGYRVLEARSGEGALQLLRISETEINLLVTDVMMPEMDGPTLIAAVREEHADLPVICISGYAEDTVRDRLAKVGNIHFLPKPFSLKQLASKVKSVLEEEQAVA